MNLTSKLNETWNILASKYDILKQIEVVGYFIITAKQIKEIREPRLVTKFDNSKDLPELFIKNNLSILPISRDSYLISNHKMFEMLEDISSYIYKMSLPSYIQSINPKNITSEAVALNCSYISGMIADFVEDENIFPTVSGRMSSKSFTFEIKNIKKNTIDSIEVTNSQIEIDGAYEGSKYLTIIEAKKTMSENFLIRQLYYPFRLWKNLIDKKIKLVFLVHSNDIFNFYQYEFKDPNNYNSLVLVKYKKYILEDYEITKNDIISILDSVEVIEEPTLAFPQADCFERVINLVEFVSKKSKTKDEVTKLYNFTKRQTDYYGNACKYLNLIEDNVTDNKPGFKITNRGKEVLKMDYAKRQLAYVKAILEHRVFNLCLKEFYTKGALSIEEIVKISQDCNLYNINSIETLKRRSVTINKWINWINNLINK